MLGTTDPGVTHSPKMPEALESTVVTESDYSVDVRMGTQTQLH